MTSPNLFDHYNVPYEKPDCDYEYLFKECNNVHVLRCKCGKILRTNDYYLRNFKHSCRHNVETHVKQHISADIFRPMYDAGIREPTEIKKFKRLSKEDKLAVLKALNPTYKNKNTFKKIRAPLTRIEYNEKMYILKKELNRYLRLIK
jgi:hypothetical protein